MSLYEKAKAATAARKQWSLDGFPGASPSDLLAIATDFGPEKDAAIARLRAENNLDLLNRGCWEIRAEVAHIPTEYREAVYRERFGVKRGTAAFTLMEGDA